MNLPSTLLPLLGSVAMLAGCGSNAPYDNSQKLPSKEVFISSIGEVIPASKLPGKIGQGELVYQKWCAGCHAAEYKPTSDTVGGDKLPPPSRLPLGTNILQQRYKGELPAVLDQRTDLTSESIAAFVRNGLNAMPPLRKTEINDAELEALSAYLTRNNEKPK